MIGVGLLQIPSRVLFGCGAAAKVGNEVKLIGKTKALIVTDKTMAEIGNLKIIKESLENESIQYEVFDAVLQEPVLEYVDDGVELYGDSGCDVIIALGGGSPIDTAKAISVMITNEGHILDYMGLDKVEKPGVPVISIPTTAGTGSEVSRFSILTDAKDNIKYFTGSPHLLPHSALVDPLMTLSMPKSVTAATGMDALCHAVEGYVSVKANPVSDMFNQSAIKLLSENLRLVYADGRNIEARTNTMLGSMYAGVSLGIASVTLVHAMSRPIGANFHTAHGLTNAALLSTVTEFNIIGKPKRYAEIAELMGENILGLSTMDAANKAVNAIKSMCNDLDIPTLGKMGIDKGELMELAPQMAVAAIASGSPANNPRQATVEEIVELYEMAYGDHLVRNN